MKPVTIVGAGFSGLTLARELARLKVPVRIVESSSHAGGLIFTRQHTHGMVETAANALLADDNVEELLHDLGLHTAKAGEFRSRRYIFWNHPARWPLDGFSSLKLLKLLLPGNQPLPEETIQQWAERTVDQQFANRLLAPALRGVYAGDSYRLSASLTVAPLLSAGKKSRGSVAPQDGMGQLIIALSEYLVSEGVRFEYGQKFGLDSEPRTPTVLATSAWAAGEILATAYPELSQQLGRCESLPLISVTAFFPHQEGELKGFGCLFPEAQGFRSLGVLFNDCIFEGRSKLRSETWIFGGALNPAVMELSDEQLKANLLTDREHLMNKATSPLSLHITRWPRALPHYTVDWEKSLRELNVPAPLYLHGNYLGDLGLARILKRSKSLALTIRNQYGS